MPARACVGNGTTGFGRALKIECCHRSRGQPEAAQRIALLLLCLWHDRRTVAQAFTRRPPLIALVIVCRLICSVTHMPFDIMSMRNGNDSVAQCRVENARVHHAAAQAKQPQQQYVNCESA
jgi:hypothetical protein